MARVHGTIAVPSINKAVTFYKRSEEIISDPYALLKNKHYYISFDPSTTSLGVYITPTDFSFHMLLRFEREGDTFDNFMIRIRNWLRWIVHGKKIDLIVYERPPWDIQLKKGRVGYAALMKFISILKYWISEIPELGFAACDTRLPNQWRTHIVDKSKGVYTEMGVRRFSSKIENAKDMVDRVPLLREYFNEHLVSSDFDGFDAFGILHGYLIERFGPNYMDNPEGRIMGNINKFIPSLVLCKQLTKEEIKNQEVFWHGLSILKTYSPVTLSINDNYSFFENMRSAVVSNIVTVTMLTTKELIAQAAWEFDLPPEEDKLYVLFILKLKEGSKAIFGKKLEKYFTSNFSYSYI